MKNKALMTLGSMQKEDLTRSSGNTVWIIRFSDGYLVSVHGTYEEAKAEAEKLKGKRRIEVIV